MDDLETITNRLIKIWPVNSTFLITGGTGFFGRWLVETISYIERKEARNNKYILLTRQNQSEIIKKIIILANPYFEIRQIDIEQAFMVGDVNYVIHAASDISKIKNTGTHDFKSIVHATRNVIQSVNQGVLKKLLYVSSGGVYKESAEAHKEDDLRLQKTDYVDSYSEAKRQSEILINELSRSCTARCFSFIGPYLDPKMAVMNMLDNKIQGQVIVVNSPQVVRSFLYPTDLIVALFKLLFLDNKNKVYNIGSDRTINLGELAQKIAVIDESSEIEKIENQSSISLAGQCYYPNIERYNSEYRELVTVDLNTALEKTYNFLVESKSL